MILNPQLENLWASRGHVQGECMSHRDSPYMYVYIPKNASSWTKPNLIDHGWEFYNYKKDNFKKHALIVLRDPVDRWISGISEFLTLYHPTFAINNNETVELIFDRITFDDHTERQIYFLDGIDTDNATFFWCDENYRKNFSQFISENYGPNKYDRYDYQHVSENSPERKKFKKIFGDLINSDRQLRTKLEEHFSLDYQLLKEITFYGS